MKILHTSDWHLGVSLYNYSLIEEQTFFCSNLLDICISNNIEAVVIAGDIFDTSVSNLEAIKLYNSVITKFIKADIKVIIIAGNHDGAARLSVFNEILEQSGLYIAGSVLNGIKKVCIKDCNFYLLPYYNIEEVKVRYPEVTNYESAMQALINSINVEPHKKNILVSHSYVNGSEIVDSDKTIMIGGTNKVSASVFEKFDYTALGHLHKNQTVGSNVIYSGSPIKFSFSEANTSKKVVIIDSVDMSIKTEEIKPKCDMRILKGEYANVLEEAKNDACKEDFIKIEITDEYAHMEIFNVFKNIYPKLLLLEGKTYNNSNVNSSLSMEKIASLNITEIMSGFYEESMGEKPKESELKWFEKAKKSVLEENI